MLRLGEGQFSSLHSAPRALAGSRFGWEGLKTHPMLQAAADADQETGKAASQAAGGSWNGQKFGFTAAVCDVARAGAACCVF